MRRSDGQCDAGRAGSAHQQDLRDSVDRQEMWRAVASAAVRAEPARFAGGEVVGDEPAGGGDDDDIASHQWRAREAPARNLLAGVGRRVARPHDGAATGVERVQDSGRTECVYATVAEGRRRARTSACIGLPKPGGVAVYPHRLAGRQVVAGDNLVATALFLGVEEVAADREGRPARSDRPPPQLDRRRQRPVGLDPHAGDDTVAMGSAKAGPVGCCLRCCRSRRDRRPLVACVGQEPLLGSLRPTPREIRREFASNAIGP
jgi:hypothetical protein